ncbi:MAG TPA: thioredoxin family protein [Phycisphaerae bacterium]|nr:thioredoxin family protein [Phycisphaerae bacterium]
MAFTLQTTEPAPDFQLPGVDGKTYSLDSFKDAKVLIVVFSCNHCPYVVGSEDRMNRLLADYGPKGVAMIAVNSNETDNHPTDSFEHMKKHAAERGFRFPYVRDESQEAARAYGALRTPHFFVFDADRKLRYTGRMDDNPREPGKQTTHELRDALDALLGGTEPPTPVTNPIGCNVKWKGQDEHWMPPEACDLV